MSYGIYIGRNLTADGKPYLAGYGDEPSSHWLELAPRAEHPEGTMITVGVTQDADLPGELTQIPQVRETARLLRVNYTYYLGVPAPLTNGGLNEHGVAVRDIWAPSHPLLKDMTPENQSGPNYSDLARMVVERARTAREGVELIAQMIADYGKSSYGGNTHMIADPDECWVVKGFAGGRKLWVAERLGADDIRASRPGYVLEIPREPNEDYLFPPYFHDTAIELGLWKPEDGPLNVNKVFGDGKGRWDGVAWIEDEMRRRAERPGKITLEDVFWSIQTGRLTGDTAGYGQVVPLEHPRHDALRVMWHAPIGPVAAPLVPCFIGMTDVPPEYRQHRYLNRGESARFLDRRYEDEDSDTVSHVPQGVEVTRSAVYEFKRLMHLAFQCPEPGLAEVWDHWRAVEAALIADLPDVLRSAELLLDAGEERLAARLLTDYSTTRLLDTLGQCEGLVASLEARMRVAGRLNMSDSPVKLDQTW